jgi:hypothetical protein
MSSRGRRSEQNRRPRRKGLAVKSAEIVGRLQADGWGIGRKAYPLSSR